VTTLGAKRRTSGISILGATVEQTLWSNASRGAAVSVGASSGSSTARLNRKYLFSDESGDLQFRDHPQVTKFFAVGTLFVDEAQLRELRSQLSEVRDELAWKNHGLDSTFHATTDAQAVRDQVFAVLRDLDFRFDVTLLEKRKAQPHTHSSQARFYRYAWFYHLKYLAPKLLTESDQLLVVAAELGTKKDRAAFRGAIEDVMRQCLSFRLKRRLAFWRDESDFALQAVDYCTWAVTRKYERGDSRSYDLISKKINSEFDLFNGGTTYYY
jgi:Protein of unknown function (DUF3800)